MHKDSTRIALLIGLALLAGVMPLWLRDSTEQLGLNISIIVGAGIPLLLMRAVYKKSRNWSGITALTMIPYSVIGVMEVVATLGSFNSGTAIAILGVSNFFLALDAGRRCG